MLFRRILSRFSRSEEKEIDEVAEEGSRLALPPHKSCLSRIQKIEIADLKHQLKNSEEKVKNLQKKLQIIKEENFNLTQDLNNSESLSHDLQEKLNNYEATNFDPIPFNLRQLSFLILSKNDSLISNSSIQAKIEATLLEKIKELEEEKERAIIKAREEAHKSRTLLKELISADNSYIQLLEFLEYGNIEKAQNQLRRKKDLIQRRIFSL